MRGRGGHPLSLAQPLERPSGARAESTGRPRAVQGCGAARRRVDRASERRRGRGRGPTARRRRGRRRAHRLWRAPARAVRGPDRRHLPSRPRPHWAHVATRRPVRARLGERRGRAAHGRPRRDTRAPGLAARPPKDGHTASRGRHDGGLVASRPGAAALGSAASLLLVRKLAARGAARAVARRVRPHLHQPAYPRIGRSFSAPAACVRERGHWSSLLPEYQRQSEQHAWRQTRDLLATRLLAAHACWMQKLACCAPAGLTSGLPSSHTSH